ncbi:MAG: recombinase family protein [Lachnospiraceae bacterium]|nr:recombinase family protein [Lachnospiraceae bacterium]
MSQTPRVKSTDSRQFPSQHQQEFDDTIRMLLRGLRITETDIKSAIESIKKEFAIPIKKVCSYGRVSTKHDEQESSLITQHTLFHKYIDSHRQQGYVLVEEIYDQKTATLAIKRAKFLNMIERAKAGEFDVLLFKDSKRMCRNTAEFLTITEDLKRHNIACVFISEGVDSLTSDRMTLTVLGMVAESHSNGLHHSVAVAKDINMQRPDGRVPSYCFGYDKPSNNDSTEMYINEYEAGLVKELFHRYVYLNEGVSTICSDWRARGIKSKLGKNVSTTMLNRMLTNAQYIGQLEMGLSYKKDVRDKRTYNETPKYIAYRQDLVIIDEELFKRAQEKKQQLNSGHGHSSINRKTVLTSKIQCACCSKNFKRIINGQNEHKAYYFKCATYKQSKRNADMISCNNKSTYRVDEVMECIGLYFSEILKNQKNITQLIKNSVVSFFKSLENNVNENSILLEIETTREEFKRYKNLYLKGMLEDDDIKVMEDIKQHLDALLDQQALLEKSVQHNFDIDTIIENMFTSIESFVSSGLDGLENASPSTIVRFNNLFHSIISTDDGRLVFNINCSDQIGTLAYTYGGRDAGLRKGCEPGADRDGGQGGEDH